MMTKPTLLLLASAAFLPINSLAQETAGPDDIIVTGTYNRSQLDILQSTSILKAEELQRSLRPTIGDTLLRLPGVSATSFAPGASRPVIRGQQGERVRVLTDGIGSIDASNTSADHAVASETLTAERIEVLRGPATLLFGSSGIGGVVNIIDGRLPTRLQEDAAHGAVAALFGSAASDWGVSGTLNWKAGKQVVLHADASYRDSSDTRIGGPAVSQALADALGIDRSDIGERKLGNSDSTVKSFGVGATAFVPDEKAYFGAVFSRFLTNYGSPIESAIRIDLKQSRLDMKAGLRFEGGFFDEAKLRFGWADYQHQELETEDGETAVGTTFLNKGWETRLELVQRAQGPWRGAMGLQYAKRDFAAIGDESFVPPNLTQQLGLFTLQEVNLEPLKLEASARYEHTTAQSEVIDTRRTFNSFNASVGGGYEIADGIQLGINLTHAVRAPSAEELFANGPHVATGVFEIGDPDLRLEKSWNAELNFHAHGDRFELHGALYHSWFKDYIFESLTGDIEDDLPVVQFGQADARYLGFEVQGTFAAYKAEDRKVSLELTADYVRATNSTTKSPLPRIPAMRLIGGLRFESDAFDLGGEIEWASKQTRIASFELPTNSYTSVNLSATWRTMGKDAGVAVVLEGHNLFDAEIRRHASFTKDLVPSAGRDIRLNARWNF